METLSFLPACELKCWIKQRLKRKNLRRKIGKSTQTLQRWDREGILKAHRSKTDRRYYTHDQNLCFSSRLYGLRKYKKKIKDMLGEKNS